MGSSDTGRGDKEHFIKRITGNERKVWFKSRKLR